ncbi:MAG: hypothetical protein AABY52_06110, partial [Deltaproteobacteria bacterium]
MRKYIISIFMIIFFHAFINNVCAHDPVEKAGAGKAKFTKHFNESLFRITEKEEFSIEVLLDDKEYKIGKGVIGIVVHDKNDDDVKIADIKISYQDMKESPVVTEKGHGVYVVSNLNIKREGKWELNIKLKQYRKKDEATFTFPDALNKLLPAGEYSSDT